MRRVSGISFSSQRVVKDQRDQVNIQILHQTIWSNKPFKSLISCYYLWLKDQDSVTFGQKIFLRSSRNMSINNSGATACLTFFLWFDKV